MARIKYEEFGRMWTARNDPQAGPQRASALFAQCLKEGAISWRDFSIREAAGKLVFDRSGECVGHHLIESCGRQKGDALLLEAGGDVVSSAAFSNITGQIFYNRMLEAYQMPDLLWPKLVETVQTQLSGENIAGISGIGDEAESIDEGEPYPRVGVGQNLITTPETVKKGFIVPITKEAIFFDMTNQLMTRCGDTGTWIAINKEKQVMNLVTGTTNNFKRNGTSNNTYATSGGHGVVNQHAHNLVDWTDIQESYKLFDAMTDWDTGEPIIVIPTAILVPFSKLAVASYILNNMHVETGSANLTAWRSRFSNPLQSMPGGGRMEILNNRFVYNSTSSTVKWFMGNFPAAFKWMQNWDFTPERAQASSDLAFSRDIVEQFKISYRGVGAVVDPHQVVYSSGGS